MMSLYKPYGNYGIVDMDRCRASVPEGGRSVGFRQCVKKPTVERDGIKFCATHDPERQKKAENRRKEKWRLQDKVRAMHVALKQGERLLVECVVNCEMTPAMLPELRQRRASILSRRARLQAAENELKDFLNEASR